jgi:AcrR family transcriptional regulator
VRTAVATKPRRSNAAGRRDAVLDAAMAEFAAGGYHGTSTTAIAKRAGISQPYVYALFHDKRELFLACHERACAHIRTAFLDADAEHDDPQECLNAMAVAYTDLVDRRDELLCRLQVHAASADPEIREPARREMIRMWEDVARATGADREQLWRFMAAGALIDVLAVLELPDPYAPVAP